MRGLITDSSKRKLANRLASVTKQKLKSERDLFSFIAILKDK